MSYNLACVFTAPFAVTALVCSIVFFPAVAAAAGFGIVAAEACLLLSSITMLVWATLVVSNIILAGRWALAQRLNLCTSKSPVRTAANNDNPPEKQAYAIIAAPSTDTPTDTPQIET